MRDDFKYSVEKIAVTRQSIGIDDFFSANINQSSLQELRFLCMCAQFTLFSESLLFQGKTIATSMNDRVLPMMILFFRGMLHVLGFTLALTLSAKIKILQMFVCVIRVRWYCIFRRSSSTHGLLCNYSFQNYRFHDKTKEECSLQLTLDIRAKWNFATCSFYWNLVFFLFSLK